MFKLRITYITCKKKTEKMHTGMFCKAGFLMDRTHCDGGRACMPSTCSNVREVSVVFRDGFSVESEFQLNPAYPMQFGTLIPNIVFITNFKVIFKVKSRIEILSPPIFSTPTVRSDL